MKLTASLTFVWLVWALTEAPAVIIASGPGNTSAPAGPADPGWSHVAWSQNGASAVYLGGGWVITAAHVGAAPISFTGDPLSGPGPVYGVVPGTAVTLTNLSAPLKSAFTDLVVFQINGDPGLPPLNISPSPAPALSQVTMIGTGRDRVLPQTVWDVDPSTLPDWTWTTPATNPGLPDLAGYAWDATRTKRWGTNNYKAAAGFEFDGFADVMGFRTTFNNNLLLPNEAQGATGDSGSAVFYNNGGSWELSGITLAIARYSGQPGDTAVYGNDTFMADLSFYRGQILAIIPEPGSGALTALAMLGLLRRHRA